MIFFSHSLTLCRKKKCCNERLGLDCELRGWSCVFLELTEAHVILQLSAFVSSVKNESFHGAYSTEGESALM